MNEEQLNDIEENLRKLLSRLIFKEKIKKQEEVFQRCLDEGYNEMDIARGFDIFNITDLVVLEKDNSLVNNPLPTGRDFFINETTYHQLKEKYDLD